MKAREVSPAQLAVLRWIVEGCVTRPPFDAYKVMALALQTRRLVEVDRRRGHAWSAVPTNQGRYFLEFEDYPHPHHPMGVNPQPDYGRAPMPRRHTSATTNARAAGQSAGGATVPKVDRRRRPPMKLKTMEEVRAARRNT